VLFLLASTVFFVAIIPKHGKSTAKHSRPLPPLPRDFFDKTSQTEVRRIARERNYDMLIIGSNGPSINGIYFLDGQDGIEFLCQSQKAEQVELGIELVHDAQRSSVYAASLLASSHSVEFLQPMIVKHIDDGKSLEIITPLIQECVARGANFDGIGSIKTYWELLGAKKNPLAWLPLHRLAIEKLIVFPTYSRHGSVETSPGTSVSGKLPEQHSDDDAGKPFSAISLPVDSAAVGSCVRMWKANSNGKLETKLFESSSDILPGDISRRQLLSLQLECLAGAKPQDVKVEVVKAEAVFAQLFSAAAMGGAYSHGEKGAYGRLAAWQSLAALAGVGAGGKVDDISKVALQSRWWSLSSTSAWFHNIAWDFGIVCLRPDRRHLAVLAATDED